MSDLSAKIPGKTTICFARPHSEVFALEMDGKPNCHGYAATFDTYSEDLGGFRATIAPGAFDRVLQGGTDCRFLVNHDYNLLFGRTASGTLRLKADDKGLYFDADPPPTSFWQHYAEEIGRGDMDGCSFSCDISIDQWDFSGETTIRTIVEIGALYDVGPVTFPAFPITSVSASYALESARREQAEQAERIEAGARRARRMRLRCQLASLLGP